MITFEKGVRFITAIRREKDGKVIFAEQRRARAIKDYESWVEAAYPNDEKGAAAAMRVIEGKGFDKVEIYTFRNLFQDWKKEKKSRLAKKSRSQRKRGRVIRKDDKRLGVNEGQRKQPHRRAT